MAASKEGEKKTGCYLTAAFSSLAIAIVLDFFFPELLPFGLFDFWGFNGSIPEVLMAYWVFFAWAFALGMLNVFTRDRWVKVHPEGGFALGLLTSATAGILEEFSFRWALFCGAVVMAQVTNFLFFGFLGFGIPEWFYTSILGPIADFFTLYYLHDYLRGDMYSWAVGAAIIGSNGRFRDGHAYQGFCGLVNSWFAGMFLFYVMFAHGLFAAMLVHFLYNAVLDVIRYVDRVVERRFGYG